MKRNLEILSCLSERLADVANHSGWVAYATSAINSAVGENKLMPPADATCMVINVDSGQSRGNGAWILGRIMRDFEYWMGEKVAEILNDVLTQKWKFDKEQAQKTGKDPNLIQKPGHAGLVVSIWEVDQAELKSLKQPGKDILFWSGVSVSILQLGLAAIPFGLYGNWGVFLITVCAILLCLATGAQHQWRREKWACRQIEPGKKRTYIMTRGNGAQHAIAIQCNGCGLNLEDLATGFDNLDSPSISLATRIAMVLLGILWVLLLITASALTEQAWFLIAVGGVGMLQNIFVAGWNRTPKALGLPLKFVDVFGSPKVFQAILDVETKYPKVGRTLVGTFFPAGIRDDEQAALQAVEADAKRQNHGQDATAKNKVNITTT